MSRGCLDVPAQPLADGGRASKFQPPASLGMQARQKRRQIMKWIRTAVATAALTAALTAASSAGAATVAHDSRGNVVVDAVPGESNRISVQPGNAGKVVLLDSGGPVLESWDGGCEQLSESMVECATGSAVNLFLDDGNDSATVDIFLTGIGVFMYGEAGDDQLSAGPFGGGIDGGPGNDKLNGGDGHDALEGGEGNDEVKGLGGSDEVRGGPGDDIVSGDSHKSASPDLVDGGPGNDRIVQDWNDLTGSLVTLTLAGGADDGRPGEGDDIRNVESVLSFNPVGYVGTEAADRIEVVQVSGPSTISGGAGDDFLKTSDGADHLDGGPGADIIDGGYNDDVIVGGPGPDSLAGDHPTGECGIYWCKLPAGNDTIDARDGERDTVTCGFGTDSVSADPIDVVAGDCENVTRVGAEPAAGAAGGKSGAKGGGKNGGKSAGTVTVSIGKVGLRKALAQGLVVKVATPGAGKISAGASLKGKRVAGGSRTVTRAGKSSVRLKFKTPAKRSLRRAKSVRLAVQVRFTPTSGSATTKTLAVSLAR
jgi:hypothetical protein